MKKIKYGIIPAAGKGVRIRNLPLTRVLPKPMLPIIDKPILEYVIENMKKFGVRTIYLIVGYKKELIQEYFKNGEDWGIEIHYIEQKELKGIAHAISLAQDYINEPFVVILGDDLTIAPDEDFQKIIETFWKNNAYVVEGIVYENDIEVLKRTCCVVLNNSGKIKEIIEKPSVPISNLRGIGIYLFDPIVFDFIKQTPISTTRGEIEITDTIKLISMKGKAFGVLINGINININTYQDFIKAIHLMMQYTSLKFR
jgi:dTDP-glucose pyrophosphorylase